MYTKKFEADSLDEALKNIKVELGPDAIILKTVTNKGIKGVLKKKRIEITAAISEKSYIKKSKVDRAMPDDIRKKFYKTNASDIAKSIDTYTNKSTSGTGYGSLGLNKSVKKNKQEPQENLLDSFLNEIEETTTYASPVINNRKGNVVESLPEKKEELFIPEALDIKNDVYKEQFDQYKKKIDYLEEKIFELTKNVSNDEEKIQEGISELKVTLKSLDISEANVQRLIKKMIFELSKDDLKSSELVFEYALREMTDSINVGMPLFSSVDDKKEGTVTLLINEGASGQTSSIYKLSSMVSNSCIVNYSKNKVQEKFMEGNTGNLAIKIFGIDSVNTKEQAEVISESSKFIDNEKNVFIDFKNNSNNIDEAKQLIEGLKRSFANVEVIISLSAIHSELYNKKMLKKYSELVDGVIFSHLDCCLNYGAIYNVHISNPESPLYFFGTGECIPDDIEAATKERLISCLFQF